MSVLSQFEPQQAPSPRTDQDRSPFSAARAPAAEAARYRNPSSRHWADPVLSGAVLVCHEALLSQNLLDQAKALLDLPAQSLREGTHAGMLAATLRRSLLQLGATTTQADALTLALAQDLRDTMYALGAEHAQLRVEIVDTQMCPKLHVDRLRARICITLAGAGTEFLPPGLTPDTASPEQIKQMPTGCLAVMAGSLAGKGLWHRSPHACDAHKRLFLSLDVH